MPNTSSLPHPPCPTPKPCWRSPHEYDDSHRRHVHHRGHRFRHSRSRRHLATWCGPCKQIAPILDELSDEYEGRVKVVKIDADTNPEAVTAAGVTSIPTLGFYRDGQRRDVLIGAHPRPDIVNKIEELLA